MRRIALALLLLLVCAVPAMAGEFVYRDGYYFRPGSTQAYEDRGYWWQDWYQARDCYGRYYWAYTWKWHYDYRPVKLDVYAEDFPTKALAVAAARDKLVLTGKNNLDLVDKLGLHFNVENYGNGMFPPRLYGQQTYQANVQTQTVDVYGKDPNYDLVIQALSRNSDRSADLTGQVIGGLADFRNTYERVAIARAQGKTAVELARELAPRSAHIETKTYGSVKSNAGGLTNDIRQAVRGSARNECAKCHADQGTAVAAFDVTKYDPATADDETMTRMRKYIGPAKDLNKNHCPPGKLLSADQRDELLFGPAAKE